MARAVVWSAMLALALLPQPMPIGVPPFNGRLYAATNQWEPSALDATRDAPLVDPVQRTRFVGFVRCVTGFRSRLPDSADFFLDSARPHQRALERALACSADGPAVEALAAAYVRRAVILYEWEGDYQSPLQEGDYAERFIAANPRSPLVPFLHVFVAARYRYAFELLDGTKGDSETARVASGYLASIAKAKATNPLVAMIADDLDGLSFVSRDIGKHPRDFR